MIVSEAFTRYTFDEIKLKGGAKKTIQNYKSTLNSFIEVNGDIPVEFITYDCVIRWKMQMDYKGHQPSTMSSRLSGLREVLKYLKKHGNNVLDHRDVELPRVPLKEVVWLLPEEIREIIESCTSVRDKALIASLFSSGGRVSEVLSLNRDSIVDGKARTTGKNSKLITLYFDKTALRYIKEYLDSRSDKIPALFISGQYRRITVSRVEQIVHTVAAEAGIEKNVTPHVFRHSFATDLITNGSDMRAAQEHLNHSSIVTTQRYLHVSKGRKDETYDRHHTVL